jgi:hypothetical protein
MYLQFRKAKFDLMEFSTNNSKIELVCGKCHGVICWWHISTEQIPLLDQDRTKVRSLIIPTKKIR